MNAIKFCKKIPFYGMGYNAESKREKSNLRGSLVLVLNLLSFITSKMQENNQITGLHHAVFWSAFFFSKKLSVISKL